ncbi:hypothetical protein PHLGIDRAFT_437396 [Phlebiopsis gigantea 11061_1 CR5-6]|uniref:Uncharacterized protein n=1 Tax=Phlebiopsis gigantea (strain 11061_1 CR5-6) TaxID=745531 RepID=A0A0C3PV62_PHLG1|nr:hypothetical protein PHLGIDRAFT_437396 [Phlebiopsis gigantea 11061_1 CR5-6]
MPYPSSIYMTYISFVLLDLLTLVVICFQTWRQLRVLKQSAKASQLLLRDGTMYFVALLAMNIAEIVISNDAIPVIQSLLVALHSPPY